MRNLKRWLTLSLCVVILAPMIGCDPPPRPPIASESDRTVDQPQLPNWDQLTSESSNEGSALSGSSVAPLFKGPFAVAAPEATAPVTIGNSTEPTLSEGESSEVEVSDAIVADFPWKDQYPWEAWDAYYINNEHIGFRHLKASMQPLSDDGLQETVRYELVEQLTLRRGPATLTHLLQQECVEHLDGRPHWFETVLHVGPGFTRFDGELMKNRFQINVVRDALSNKQTIRWRQNYHGLMGVPQLLRRRPMKVGDTVQFKTLVPILYQIGSVKLTATKKVAIAILDRSSPTLTEIKGELSVGGDEIPAMTSYYWMDGNGEVLKTYLPAFQLTGYRTDKATATALVKPSHDLLAMTSVKLKDTFDHPRRLALVEFQLTPIDGSTDPAKIPVAPMQTPGPPASDGSVRVTVVAGEDLSKQIDKPTDADLASGFFIDWRSKSIAQLGLTMSAQGASKRNIATGLTNYVHRYVNKGFSRGFSKASTVADDATGDCTEHAVFLAALLRSRGIPCRVVAGLVYTDTPNGPVMMYHMWNVAYVDGGWISLDATLGMGTTAADRIALVVSDLEQESEYQSMMPILETLGRFEIRVIRFENASSTTRGS